VRAWDALVRLAHWTLAAAVAFDLVRDDGDQLHRTIGYVAVGAVVLRLLWACVARNHARLAELKPSLAETRRYVRQLLAGKPPRSPGHDPLGLWMVWLIWVLVLGLGVTGWISRLDAYWGEDWPIDIHAALADALLACVVVHLLGVLAMSRHWRENLAASMLTGRKRGDGGRGDAPR
jgi:cytochrome b